MHNLLTRNQLDEWRHLENTIDELEIENQKIADYYECLIECDALGQHECKQICRGILMNQICSTHTGGVDTPLFLCYAFKAMKTNDAGNDLQDSWVWILRESR